MHSILTFLVICRHRSQLICWIFANTWGFVPASAFTEIAAAILDIFALLLFARILVAGVHSCSWVMGAVHQKVLEPVLAKIKYPTTLVLPDTREGTFELAPMWWVLGGDRRDESLNWLSALKFLLYLISEKRGLLKVRFWPHVLSAVMLTTEVRQQLRLSTVSNECDREKFWWKANVKICDFRSLFLNTECT